MSKAPSILLLSSLLLIFVFSLSQQPGQAAQADCGCDYNHPLNVYKLDGSTAGLQPGDTVCLGSGARNNMRITNVVGTADQPITIQNCGGTLDIQTTTFGITMDNNRYLRVTGTGVPGVKYGIKVGGQIGVEGLTSNVEMDHIEMYNSGNTGMSVKTDPTCDPATWRENFTMHDVSIHDNYAHDTTTEGFYIGYTFYFGRTITCDGQPTTVFGHIIDGLEVYNNVTHNTGREGIQIHSAPLGNARIFNNQISDFGEQQTQPFQDNGMQIGSANIHVYNNRIEDGPAVGLIVFGEGHKVYNNVIVNPGSHGIFATDQQNSGPGQAYFNNTIVSPGEDGMRFYTDGATTTNQAFNNLIVDPGTDQFITKLNSGVPLEASNNLMANTINEVMFVTPGNYQLQAASPAVDAGKDVSTNGVIFDIEGRFRPVGVAFDIGAYEYAPPTGPLDQMIWLPAIIR